MAKGKLKIALIDPVGGHGGMDYYDYGLALGLAQNECEVDFYTCAKTKIEKFDGVTTFLVFGDLWNKRKPQKLFLFLHCYWKVVRMAKTRKSEIAHLHFFSFSSQNFLALLLLKFYGLKMVVTIHDIDSFHGSSKRWIEKWSYSLMDGAIVHNRSSYQELKRKKIKFPPLAVIPHGNYKPFVRELPLPNPGKEISLLFFGQIKEVKGLDVLLRAFAKVVRQHKNFSLTIAGRPWKTDKTKYEGLIKELGLENNVETHFRYLEETEIEQLHARADIIILPYKRIYQSGVLLMSMSYGRTVIASDLPAFKELVKDGENGFLFQSENAKDLARCILKLDKAKIKFATIQAKASIEGKFNWVNIGAKTKEFYKKM